MIEPTNDDRFERDDDGRIVAPKPVVDVAYLAHIASSRNKHPQTTRTDSHEDPRVGLLLRLSLRRLG